MVPQSSWSRSEYEQFLQNHVVVAREARELQPGDEIIVDTYDAATKERWWHHEVVSGIRIGPHTGRFYLGCESGLYMNDISPGELVEVVER